MPIIRADPNEYVKKYGSSLLHSSQIPKDILNIKHPEGIVLAADVENQNSRIELEGDIDALGLIDDLDEQGLGEYKDYVRPQHDSTHREAEFITSPAAGTLSTPTSNLTSISNLSNCLITNNNKINNYNNNMPTTALTINANNNANNKNLRNNNIDTQYDNNKSNSLDLVMTPPSTISYHNSTNMIKTFDSTLTNNSTIDEKSLLTAINEIFDERQKNGYVTSKETFNVLIKLNRSIGRQIGEKQVKQILNSHLDQNGLINRNGFANLFQKVLLN